MKPRKNTGCNLLHLARWQFVRGCKSHLLRASFLSPSKEDPYCRDMTGPLELVCNINSQMWLRFVMKYADLLWNWKHFGLSLLIFRIIILQLWMNGDKGVDMWVLALNDHCIKIKHPRFDIHLNTQWCYKTCLEYIDNWKQFLVCSIVTLLISNIPSHIIHPIVARSINLIVIINWNWTMGLVCCLTVNPS